MPLDADFLERAEHNERFLSTLDLNRTDYLDWAVTIAFYVVLRYVDAFFFPARPASHPERLQMVATNPRTRPISNSYRELYNQARDARYELTEYTAFEVESLITNRMNHVKLHMMRQ